MTAAPAANTNTGDLEDMACPDCGQFERFGIDGLTVLTVTDDGTEDHGEFGWADDADADCPQCGWAGPVDDLNLDFAQFCASPAGLRDQAARADFVDKLT